MNEFNTVMQTEAVLLYVDGKLDVMGLALAMRCFQ